MSSSDRLELKDDNRTKNAEFHSTFDGLSLNCGSADPTPQRPSPKMSAISSVCLGNPTKVEKSIDLVDRAAISLMK